MSDPTAIERDGHRTWLKWHRAKRRIGDPVFTGRRILEGMRLGASVEVDMVVTGGRGFAVLHDLELDRETTGQGRVAAASHETLRQLHLRGEDGAPIADKVMLLDDLCALMAQGQVHADALLQLDYKEDWRALDAAAIASFQQSTAPVARHMILSSGDAEAVRVLTEGVQGLRIGYDPCHNGALERLQQSRDFAGFVGDAVSASPRAEMIYLHHALVLEADRLGFDLVQAFHTRGKRIDAYTINRADAENRAKVARLLELKVDQITTDDPEGLLALMG